MLVIRKATPEDVPTVLQLVRDLATYEKEPLAVVATEADFLRDGFGDAPVFKVLVAEENDAIVGFALYFFTWSTWVGKSCLHLEDLYVRPEKRGLGAGLLLMQTLAKEAVERGCARFVWQVMDWNAPAIGFYERLGAKVMKEWIAVRLDGEPLGALAGAKPANRC
ncbi:MAG: GNAT family N-acetyltransferase [Labilithrix sp.]|nr:GNAT family N-acetyltransferase [Labilithrix sp.]